VLNLPPGPELDPAVHDSGMSSIAPVNHPSFKCTRIHLPQVLEAGYVEAKARREAILTQEVTLL